MSKPKYEYCEAAEIRELVEKRLHKLPACKSEDESPAEFWSRVDRAGLLLKSEQQASRGKMAVGDAKEQQESALGQIRA